jgi:hypothetical protein
MSSPLRHHDASVSAGAISHSRLARAGRPLVALMAFVAVLAVSACGAGQTTAVEQPTVTPGQTSGSLYLLTVAGSSTSTITTTASALALGDGALSWHAQVTGSPTGFVAGGGALYIGSLELSPAGPPTGSTLSTLSAHRRAGVAAHVRGGYRGAARRHHGRGIRGRDTGTRDRYAKLGHRPGFASQ